MKTKEFTLTIINDVHFLHTGPKNSVHEISKSINGIFKKIVKNFNTLIEVN